MIIAVKGEPGSGKTTICKLTAEKLAKSGLKICGFITQEVRNEKNEREGFEIYSFCGKKTIFSSVNLNTPYRVGRYRVDIRAFEEIAIPNLEDAVLKKCNVLIIDEIGKMEMISEKFRDRIQRIITSYSGTGILVVTLPVYDFHPIIKEIVKRADKVFYTSRSSKNSIEVSNQIVELITKFSQSM
ncbi:MAG: nucleoside-triphosphatase [Candidatus Hydrothermia bacterium]